jgi:hypothetical protein
MINIVGNGTSSVVHSKRIHNEILSSNGPLLAVNTCSEKKNLIPMLQLLGFDLKEKQQFFGRSIRSSEQLQLSNHRQMKCCIVLLHSGLGCAPSGVPAAGTVIVHVRPLSHNDVDECFNNA